MWRHVLGLRCLGVWVCAVLAMIAASAAVVVVEITDISTVSTVRPILVLAFKSWDPSSPASVEAFAATAAVLAPSHPDLAFGQWDMALYPPRPPSGLVVRGYPAYLLFAGGSTVLPRKYIGPPTPKAIENWLTNSSPMLEFDSTDEWSAYLAKTQEPIAVAILPDLHGPERLVVEALAEQDGVGLVALRPHDWSVDGQLAPQLWVVDRVMETRSLYSGVWTAASLAVFVVKQQRPWLGVYDPNVALDPSTSAYGVLFPDATATTPNCLLTAAEQILTDSRIKTFYDIRFLVVPTSASHLATFFDITTFPAIVWFKDAATFSSFPSRGAALEELVLDHANTELVDHLVAFLEAHRDVVSPDDAQNSAESSAPVEITSLAQLEAFVASSATSTTASLVAFYSVRCPSCSALLPRLHDLSVAQRDPAVRIAIANVDSIEYRNLVDVVGGTRFSVPAVYVCRDGKVYRRVGTDSAPPTSDDLVASVVYGHGADESHRDDL